MNKIKMNELVFYKISLYLGRSAYVKFAGGLLDHTNALYKHIEYGRS